MTQNLEIQMKSMALDNLIKLLVDAIPTSELRYGPIEISRSTIYKKFYDNRGEIERWVKRNNKQLLINLITISL